MKLPLYQIDAFATRVFSGNPAAVCPLPEWLPEEQMQRIASENNLSETAFFVRRGEDYELRWFTPTTEVELCGHATLASAYLIFSRLEPNLTKVNFHSKTGVLSVAKQGKLIVLDFPSLPASACRAPAPLLNCLGCQPKEVLKSSCYMAVYEKEEEVQNLQPDMEQLLKVGRTCLIVTAPGRKADFVSRFFAPAFGIPEDPVTGSAHCTLIPYWSARLNKSELVARQISARGGELFCSDRGDRVKIGGEAVLYLEGEIRT
jgi:PhzF family phenazine biosynthesis protein